MPRDCTMELSPKEEEQEGKPYQQVLTQVARLTSILNSKLLVR
jgi:hypothetical protein